jgi:hypothetical protein
VSLLPVSAFFCWHVYDARINAYTVLVLLLLLLLLFLFGYMRPHRGQPECNLSTGGGG